MISFNIEPNTLVITFDDGEGGKSIYATNTYFNRPFISMQDAKEFAEKALSQGHVYFVKPLSLEETKIQFINNCSNAIKIILDGRPIIDTGLGFSVDGGYKDLEYLKGGKATGSTVVRDAANEIQTITLDDWDTIISAIQAHNANLLQSKWDYEKDVNEAESIEDIKNIEKPFN